MTCRKTESTIESLIESTTANPVWYESAGSFVNSKNRAFLGSAPSTVESGWGVVSEGMNLPAPLWLLLLQALVAGATDT
jgi:hypothetical protein